MRSELKVAVVEGWHPFDVLGYHALFRALQDIDYYPQTIENWAVDCAAYRKQYDAVVFYNMNMELPRDYEEPVTNAIADLGETGQGLLFLHHAILAFPNSEIWAAAVGLPDRSLTYHPGQDLTIEIADPDHPITRGLQSWTMRDETYVMANPGPDSHALFTTDHPKSMKTLGWTRTFRNARVFCFQPGHDRAAWEHPHFREVLLRGIRWCSNRG